MNSELATRQHLNDHTINRGGSETGECKAGEPQMDSQRIESRRIPAAAGRLRVSVVSDAVQGRNGVGTYYADLVCHLEQEVDQIDLMGPMPERDRRLERFAVPMLGDSTQRLAFPKTRELYRRLNAQQPHVIVLPSIGPFSYAALRFARHHRVPIAVVNHTSFDHLIDLYWPGRFSMPLRSALARLQRWLISQASGVAAMNVESLREARQMGAPLVRVMGTPICSSFLYTPRTKVNAEPARIVFVGRLAQEKRLEDVLDAAAHMPEKEFFVAGDGPMKAEVMRLAKQLPNLHYLGWLNRDQVLRAMDDADVLVLPSALETFGTVALEALARRRFVVVSRECGISAWPTLSKGLFFIERGEVLADSLQRLSGMDQGEREEHAMQSWLAVEDFNNHTLRGWLRFLVDVAGMQREDASDSQVSVVKK